MILEINSNFDTIFIQEPPQSIVQTTSSLTSEEGEKIISTSNHPNQITFSSLLLDDNNFPRVISYINIWLLNLHFLHKDIYNHRDICCISFLNNREIFFLYNIYSNSNQSALKYLKNTEANIHNVLIMTRKFNIKNRDWDSFYLFHLVYSDLLFDIADSFNLLFS